MATNWSGPDLAVLRRNKGLSLSNIAQDTKIGVRYLEAIELGQFSKLPGGCYGASYIRQYAQALEYDEAELLEYYRGVTEEAPSISGGKPAPGKSSHKTPWAASLSRLFDIGILRNVSDRK